jgi:hypothetical protein
VAGGIRRVGLLFGFGKRERIPAGPIKFPMVATRLPGTKERSGVRLHELLSGFERTENETGLSPRPKGRGSHPGDQMMRDDETSADASLRETRVVLARQRARTLRVVAIARHHQAESTRQLLLRTIETAKLNAATTRAERARASAEQRWTWLLDVCGALEKAGSLPDNGADLGEDYVMGIRNLAARAEQARAMFVELVDACMAAKVFLEIPVIVLANEWRADAERKGNGNV